MACGYGTSLFAVKNKNTKEQYMYGAGINTDSQIGYLEEPPRSGGMIHAAIIQGVNSNSFRILWLLYI